MSSTKDSRAVLLFAAGCLTGAGVAAAVVSARKARAAEREAQTDCPAADMAAQQPSSIPGSSNKADSSPAAVGGYRPHQHEAKIKERIDRMERNESFRGERLGSSTRSALREMIREEVVSFQCCRSTF
jgi:hypothetical protein